MKKPRKKKPVRIVFDIDGLTRAIWLACKPLFKR